MNEQHNPQQSREALEAENDFLKMKLMLEKGAIFGSTVPDEERDPQMDNDFLKYIMAFEAQMESQETIPIRQFLGFPEHFKPVNEIAADAFDAAWEEAASFLRDHRIELMVCTPNVTTRELYRFFYEEFLDADIDAVDVPGCVYTYHYDNFHPDPVYESSRVADECIRDIFSVPSLRFGYYFVAEGVQLNQYDKLTPERYENLVMAFRSRYEEVDLTGIEEYSTTLSDDHAIVKGLYSAVLSTAKETDALAATWEVTLQPDAQRQFWYVKKVVIDGIEF